MYSILVWDSFPHKVSGGRLRPAKSLTLRGARQEARHAAARGMKRGGAAVIGERGEWLYEKTAVEAAQ